MLRRFLDDNALTPTTLARQLGLVTPNLFYNFLNGHSNSLSQAILELIAQRYPTLAVSPHPGVEQGAQVCPVVAIAAIGLEQAAFRLDEAKRVKISLPTSLPAQHGVAFGVWVGEGAERVYAAGSLVICCEPAKGPSVDLGGQRLLVSRRLGNGIEVSLREPRVHNGQLWLWSMSDRPEKQTPITRDGVTVEGIVLASWRIESSTMLA